MSLARGKLLRHAVLLAAVLALLIPVILIERGVLQRTEGNFTLPHDQSFITIAVGKNLAFFGVWGLSKHAFQPAASSLIYPVVLAPFFFIAGAHLLIPLMINVIAAILLLRVVQRSLRRWGARPGVQLTILLLLVFCIPLFLLVISGMEYTLFLLLLALFWTRRPDRSGEQLPWPIYAYAFLLVATRYEGMVPIAAICVQLLFWRRRRLALWLALAGIAPILLFGIISLSKGGHFIPQALLQPLGAGIYTAAIVGGVFIIAALTAPQQYNLPLQYKRQAITYSLFGLIAIIRTTTLLGDITRTSVNTYYQQIQTVRFVHRYYNRAGISLNETGALSYFSEGRKIDLTGIANYSVRMGKGWRYWSPMVTDSLSRWEGARLGILSGPQSGSRPAGSWDKVASWNNPINSVSFYALDTAFGRQLRLHLKEYEKSLPAGMQVRYY
jgi:hypothetical protein